MQGQFDLPLFSVALESCEEVYIIYYNIGALDKQEYGDVEDDNDKESNYGYQLEDLPVPSTLDSVALKSQS